MVLNEPLLSFKDVERLLLRLDKGGERDVPGDGSRIIYRCTCLPDFVVSFVCSNNSGTLVRCIAFFISALALTAIPPFALWTYFFCLPPCRRDNAILSPPQFATIQASLPSPFSSPSHGSFFIATWYKNRNKHSSSKRMMHFNCLLVSGIYVAVRKATTERSSHPRAILDLSSTYPRPRPLHILPRQQRLWSSSSHVSPPPSFPHYHRDPYWVFQRRRVDPKPVLTVSRTSGEPRFSESKAETDDVGISDC